MYSGTENNKRLHPLKAKETKRISRFIKALKSFDENRSIKKQKSTTSKQENQNFKIDKNLFINLNVRRNPFPQAPTAQRYSNIRRNIDNFSTISKSSKFSGQKVSLPSISLDISFPQKVNQSNRALSSSRVKTQAIFTSSKKLPKIFINKLEGVSTGNLLQFLKLKPTEKYFSKKQNVRIAQKLLLAKPSKGLRRSQQKKFYNQQQSYRSISQSSLKLNQNSPSVIKKVKHHKHSKSQWIN